MRSKCLALILIAGASFALVGSICADTYSTFRTARYYSSSRRYFVEVHSNKRATLFHNGHHRRRIWTSTLPDLPAQVFVKDDGSRVALLDIYYGNRGSANTPVVTTLDKNGKTLTTYSLGQVANLERVLETISTAHWCKDARLSQDERFLLVETVVAKRDRASCTQVSTQQEADECFESVPYQTLRIDMESGKLIERTKAATK